MTALTQVSGTSDTKALDTPPQKAKVGKKRATLTFASRSVERLDALKLKTGASSYAEVVNKAVRLYEELIDGTKEGNQFLVRDKYGVVAPLRLLL